MIGKDLEWKCVFVLPQPPVPLPEVDRCSHLLPGEKGGQTGVGRGPGGLPVLLEFTPVQTNMCVHLSPYLFSIATY